MRLKYEPVAQLKEAFKDLMKKWKYIPLIVIIDLAFLTVFGFIYNLYFNKILSHMISILQALPAATDALQQTGVPSAEALAPVFGINASLSAIYVLGIQLAISTFLIWVIFQAPNWRFAHKIANAKTDFLRYIKGFGVASIIWFAIFSVIMYVSVSTTLYNAYTTQMAVQDMWTIYATVIAVAVLGYFALVSYSVTGKIREVLKKTVVNCFLKLKIFVSYIILLIILLILNFIILGLTNLNSFAGIVIGAILLLLYFVYARVYMIEVVNKL
ncbi:hypothetical protein KY308_02440, partial [Candidatus Woesearchaeota archaeon]|nr:hypothetical protein [Candidatus Woesearchaeota archaeon]